MILPIRDDQSDPKAAGRQGALRINVWNIKGEKSLVRTLLGIADHHELLADVATAVHRDKKLSHIFFHRVDLIREEHCRLCLEESGESKRRESEGKKKRVIICITICKNPHYIRPSSTDTGFCSGSALVSRSWHFLFGSIEVVVPQCAYSNSKITLHRIFSVWSNQRCSSKGPLRKFFSLPGVSLSITHASLSERISWEFYISAPLYTEVSTRPSLVFSSLAPLVVPERSLWLRDGLRTYESIYLSKWRTYCSNNKYWSRFPQAHRDQ